MKKKFRLIAILLALIILFCLASCDVGEKPASGAPSAPQNFTAVASDRQVTLTWTAPSDKGDSDIIKYEVSKDNGSTWTDAGLVVTYTFTGLTNGTSYTFKVRAVNGSGSGAAASKVAKPEAGSVQQIGYDYTKLPQNVKIKFTNSINNTIGTYSTIIKIGNDIYSASGLADPEEKPDWCSEYYLKYDNGTWTEYQKEVFEDTWEVTGDTYTATTLGARLKHNDYINLLIDTAGTTLSGTSVGTEEIAHQQTTKYTLTSGVFRITYWYHSATKLYLRYKTEGGSTNVEIAVTLWDEAVVNFGDIDLP